jgi:hypothetical protein
MCPFLHLQIFHHIIVSWVIIIRRLYAAWQQNFVREKGDVEIINKKKETDFEGGNFQYVKAFK